MSLATRWRGYWFRPNRLIHLAILRLIVVAFQLGYVTKNDTGWYFERFQRLAQLPDSLYRPLPILRLLIWPLGWEPNWYRPSFEVLLIVYWFTMVVGVLALIGFKTNLSLFGFVLGNVFMQAYIYSFVEFHHPEALLVMTLMVLALCPSGAVLSVDDLRRRLRLNTTQGRFEPFNLLEETSIFATWPLLLIQYMYALIYLSSAISKIRAGGLDWMNGYTLQYYFISDGLRKGLEFGVWLGQFHTLAWVMSVMTILFEATFFLVLIFPVLAWIYVPMGVGLHSGIYVLMRAPFFQLIIIYAVFIPWVPFARNLSRRLGLARSTAKPLVILSDSSPGSIRWMTIIRYFDWFDRLAFGGPAAAIENPAPQPDLVTEETLPAGIQVRLADGTVQSGFLAFRKIMSSLPLFWPVALVFQFPLVSTLAPRLYTGLLRAGS